MCALRTSAAALQTARSCKHDCGSRRLQPERVWGLGFAGFRVSTGNNPGLLVSYHLPNHESRSNSCSRRCVASLADENMRLRSRLSEPQLQPQPGVLHVGAASGAVTPQPTMAFPSGAATPRPVAFPTRAATPPPMAFPSGAATPPPRSHATAPPGALVVLGPPPRPGVVLTPRAVLPPGVVGVLGPGPASLPPSRLT